MISAETKDFLKTGLSLAQVEQQKKAGKINTSKTKTTKTYLQIVLSNLLTWFNLICFVLAGLLISVESYENILFVVVFLANLTIGLVQEIKAKTMVDKINVIYETKVTAIRQSTQQKIATREVVENDLLVFGLGDQICADCIVLEGSVEVNESMLTGESVAIKKQVGDKLLGGSFVLSGSAKAQATKVGLETYSSTLIKKARELKPPQSDILKTLNLIIKSIGAILLPLGILTFLDSYSKTQFVKAIETTSGSIIGMMPVGMFLLTSVSLVVGVLNLAKQKTLVQDLYSLETLARVNVLCVDKTGTITDGTMRIKNFVALQDEESVTKIMQSYVFATKTQNATALALDAFFKTDSAPLKAVEVMEFNSSRKFSAVKFENGKIYALGAPEFVCKNLLGQEQTIQNLTQEGLRVIVLCECNCKTLEEISNTNTTPVGIVCFEDNIRPDAKETFEWLKKNDVDIKIISGDNVNTVSTISKKIGIKDWQKCISLENMTDAQVEKCATKYSIFGRVTPEQKAILIKALKKSGKKVAMTGDGVNDILALKEADCSIAMASGSEATRSASNLIMLDSNFSAMPQIVLEGRRVINNISKASSLFLTKTFFTMFLTIFVLVLGGYTYPLQPNQIFLWETFFIGIPAFVLALQPNKERIKGSFIASLSSKALPGALVLFFSAIACYIYCSQTNQPELISTLVSYSATFGAFFVLLNLCQPLDRYRSVTLFCMLGLALLAANTIPNSFFNYLQIGISEMMFLLVSLVAIYILYFALRKMFEKIFKFNSKAKKSKQKN